MLEKLQQQAADVESRLTNSEQRLVDSEKRGDDAVKTLADLQYELEETAIVAADATELRALCSRLQREIDEVKQHRASDGDMITETTQVAPTPSTTVSNGLTSPLTTTTELPTSWLPFSTTLG